MSGLLRTKTASLLSSIEPNIKRIQPEKPGTKWWRLRHFSGQTGAGCKEGRDSAAESEAKVFAKKTAFTSNAGLDSTWGRITGRVIFEGDRPAPQKLLVVKDVAVCGKQAHFDQRLTVSEDKGIQNAVISILDIGVGNDVKPNESDYVLDQTGCEYRPHVVILPVNTPLQILNNDGILHNIHTYGTRNNAVNIAQPQFKKKAAMAFSEPEAISVRCDIHGWMSAWIIVVEHLFHGVTDHDGNFVIDNVPAGTYKLKCWQEVLGEETIEVIVESGSTVSAVCRYSQ
jgi:hypothetical protein